MLKIVDWSNGSKVCHYDHALIDLIDKSLKEGVIQGLLIRKTSYIPEDSISWLSRFSGVKIIGLYDFSSKIDLSGLSNLPEVEELLIDGKAPVIDFLWCKALKTIAMDWRSGVFKNTHLSGLIDLRLWKYSSRNLGDLQAFSCLKRLKLVQSSLENLNGISDFDQLECLELHYMKKLIDISDLKLMSLKALCIENCNKIVDYNSIGSCVNLEVLRVHESATINSLGFVDKLASLKSFRFVGTDVADGNLSPLSRLNDVYFTHKRHFSHKVSDLRQAPPGLGK